MTPWWLMARSSLETELKLINASYDADYLAYMFKAVVKALCVPWCQRDGDHEVSWGWLWEIVERMLMGSERRALGSLAAALRGRLLRWGWAFGRPPPQFAAACFLGPELETSGTLL